MLKLESSGLSEGALLSQRRERGLHASAGPRTPRYAVAARASTRGQPTLGSNMVDLAELARQMKAIGRKGSGKDYYEQYVAAGIALRWGRSQKECVSCPRWDM